jgi:NMD protein affecting ribosome stability and mRNA decay
MRNTPRSSKPGSRLPGQTRGNPRLQEKRHDPYRQTAKSKGPARCKQCGATYVRGQWRWQPVTPAPKATTTCSACQRIADRYPAGEVLVRGAFVASRRGEIESLIRHTADKEGGEHPLHRIMQLRRKNGGFEVTTTDIHLPHRIGHALKDAWGGELETHYDDHGYYARVTWQRD